MPPFLSLVAQDLYRKSGGGLSHTAIVFPNKRASLFFNQYLASQSDRPLWSPAYISISDLFQSLSPLHKGDPIRLVCELYRIFTAETDSRETLDDFYFWGELLIADFDDLDKNLVDADRLFANLGDLKAITDDTGDFLDPEQVEAIRQFFHNFSPDRRTELKERFRTLWDKLGVIYHRYRSRLSSLGIAYEGMMYRRVMETLDLSRLPHERYVFVGFNVLNQVETQLFDRLHRAGRALFYWDYDHFYTRPSQEQLQQGLPFVHEAGEFIRRNLQRFPNELPPECFDAMSRPKRIRYISAPTENAQARFIGQLPAFGSEQEGQPATGNGQAVPDSAIVLCNESLLLPVLHSLPEETEHVNITMGFPLAQTPVYSFINAYIDLQVIGYRADSGRYRHEPVIALLRHPYTRSLSAAAERLERQLTHENRFYPLPAELKQDSFLELLFTPQNGNLALCRQLTLLLKELTALYRPDKCEEDMTEKDTAEDIFNQLYRESLFKSHTLIGRLSTLIEDGDLEGIKTDTLRRLLTRLLTTAGIPFHGEPAIGLQVMGVLETRNLDFRRLTMLSVNEGQLPKAEGDSSFIPYNLRRAFGMTTIEHKNAVYAYYFYRLIQRAEEITLLYNTSSDGLNRGEMSRFMLQFLVESPHNIEQYYLEAGQTPLHALSIRIDKTPEMVRRLCDNYDIRLHPDAILSPSALNTYMDCPMRFYYRYVCRLRTPDEVSAEIDNALFGTIFHRAAELAYHHLTARDKYISKESLQGLLKETHRLQSFVDTAFKEKFFHIKSDEKAQYNGTQLINSRVILSYLRQLLRNDLQYAPFSMEGMEQHVAEVMEIDTPAGQIPIQIGGTIDRMDSKDDTLRIVDYKTGGNPKTPEGIEQLFTPAFDRPGYIFQTFLYAAILYRKQSLKVAPSLLYIHRAASESYSPVIEMGPARQPKIPVSNFALYEDDFRNRLQTLLHDIFDPNVPFTQTEEKRECERCDFRNLCKR